MPEQENTKIALDFFHALNRHDLSKSHSWVADDFQVEAPGTAGPITFGQAQLYNQKFLTAFPDLHFDITRTIAQGDYVVVHWTGTGTNTGPLETFVGITFPQTDKKVTVSGTTTVEVKGDKATRAWTYWDTAALLNPLGLIRPT